ncbi:MAG: hypothetical protein Q8O40_05270 [Chloroflexota bacterium]|nr:hypothetical protein [Chloroflexota bacterium]
MESKILEKLGKTRDGLPPKNLKGRDWNALKGDVCCRVIMQFLQDAVGPSRKVVGPNAWIRGSPTEFDLLIAGAEAVPHELTAVYDPADVLACLEVKEHGLFGGREQVAAAGHRKRDQFDAICKEHSHIKCAYLTLKEAYDPVGEGSIDYLEATIDALHPYPVFCFQHSRRLRLVRTGEWDRMLAWLLG